jgi:uncharacterized membrane protein
MEARPIIKLTWTWLDYSIEYLGWLALAIFWVLIWVNYAELPHTIPSHFNWKGEVDGYGSRETMLLLPIIATLVFVGLTILNRYPHLFNYPSPITADKAVASYTAATRLIRFMKTLVVFIFGFISYHIMYNHMAASL